MRVLETPRLLLHTDAGPTARTELEAVFGQHVGRPAIVIKESDRRIGHCRDNDERIGVIERVATWQRVDARSTGGPTSVRSRRCTAPR